MSAKFQIFFLNALWGQFNIFQTLPPPTLACWKPALKYQEMVLSCGNVFICLVSKLLNCSPASLPAPSGAFRIPGAGRWLGLALCQAFVTHSQSRPCRLPSEKKTKKTQQNKTPKQRVQRGSAGLGDSLYNLLPPSIPCKAASPLLNISSKTPFFLNVWSKTPFPKTLACLHQRKKEKAVFNMFMLLFLKEKYLVLLKGI